MPTLPFIDPAAQLPDDGAALLSAKEDKAAKGVANGYAPLDASAKVPIENLPDQAALDAEVAAAVSAHNALTNAHGISNTGNLVYTSDARLSNSRAPTAHKASHATGGADALTPSDIGAQPAGSYELTTSKNTANGYAGLDADGKIDVTQLPASNALDSEAIAFAIALS